jgi:stress-induced morphogen
MTKDQLKERIETLSPETRAELKDLTGTKDHWQATIVSPAFAGKSMVEQHQMIYRLFKAEMATNEVHALSLKTYTPEQLQQNGGSHVI